MSHFTKMYTTVQKVMFLKVVSHAHQGYILLDKKKYNKNNNIVKYCYILK